MTFVTAWKEVVFGSTLYIASCLKVIAYLLNKQGKHPGFTEMIHPIHMTMIKED